jgi:hypothetical protein
MICRGPEFETQSSYVWDDDGVVPPNASLQMDLELVSWKTVSDITKDMKVLKKILKEWDGYERPNDGAMVQGTVLLIKAFKGFCTLFPCIIYWIVVLSRCIISIN